jgi:ABC-type nickel/cobalt efflux system permease component RcnA
MVKEKIKKFHLEFKKAVKTALIAAFGFIIALVWRDFIVEVVNKISSQSPVQGQLVVAITTTLIAVVGILIVTKYVRVEEDDAGK